MSKLSVEMCISSVSSNKEPFRYIRLRLTDSVSGTTIADVDFSFEEFAKALMSSTGQGIASWNTQNLGKKRQVKTESVFVPKGEYKSRNERAKAAIAPFEVNGWRGYVNDATNHHRRESSTSEGDWQTVSFTRFVDVEQTT